MTVYCLMHSIMYEGDELLSVHASEASAKTKLLELEGRFPSNDYWVKEEEVQE